ncbi:MAG: TonB-dependent receptor [Acidobacteriota bacterium]|nr:TonB-dependent receptor [Acidobacteriota bacterium]
MLQNRCLVFLFLCLGVVAAEPDEVYTETVTVTASRTPVLVEETGSSVTVIDREEIERRQSIFVGDLLRAVPGVAISRAGNGGSLTQIRVRGGEANHVLLSIDGVSISDAFAGDEVPLELLTVFDLDRVEVLRGPQSGLWGGDAAAGVINLVTRDPGAAAGRALQFETGSFGLLRGAGQIGLGDGAHRATFSGSFHDMDGTNVSRTGNEDDGSSSGLAHARYRFAPESSPFVLELGGRFIDTESEFDGVDFVVTGLPTDADRRTETSLSILNARGAWTRDDSSWRHELNVSRVSSDTETVVDASFDSSTAVDKNFVSWQSTVALPGTLNQRLTFAVDHESREFEQRGIASFFGDPNQSQKLDADGGVIEYHLGQDQWDWAASVRHDRHSDFDDATTFRTSFARRWHDGATRLHVSAGTGHKPPTFGDRFGFFADTFIGNPNLQPEESSGWDVGVDRRLGKRYRVGATYFRERVTNEINGFFFDATAGAFTAVNEDGDSDRQGVEVSVIAQLSPPVQLATTYTYTDAREPNGLGGEAIELRRPRHSGNLQLHYNPSRLPFDVAINASFVDTQRDIFFPPFPAPPERVPLDSYVLLDITGRYQFHDNYELFARIENALDEEYEDVIGFATPELGAFVGLRFRSGR